MKYTKPKLIFSKVSAILIVFFLVFNAQFSSAATFVVNSTTNLSPNPFVGLADGDEIIVNARLTINANISFTQNNLIFTVNSGGELFWSGNYTLTLASGSAIILNGTGLLSQQPPCNANKLIVIGSFDETSCNGGGPGINFSFSNINDAGGVNEIGPLPVRVSEIHSSFQTSLNKIKVSWTTVEEVNNSHFNIYKKDEKGEWIYLDKVDGIGNSSQNNTYTYFDYFPSEINFYKIEQVDFDGTAISLRTTHAIVNFNNSKPKSKLTLYPNPATDIITIEGFDEIAVVNIFTIGGKLVQNTFLNDSNPINISHLSAGVYVVKISTVSDNKTIRIIKE